MEGGGGASLVESLRAKWICTAVFSSAPHMQIEFLMRIFFFIYIKMVSKVQHLKMPWFN